MPRFTRFAAFDWSGAATARPPGLVAAEVGADGIARRFGPDRGWSRGDVAGWLADAAHEGADLLVGIDISMGLPFADAGAFFPGWDASPVDAPDLWALVDRIAGDEPHLGANRFVGHDQASRYFRHTGRLGDRYGPASGRLRVVEHASREQGIANPYSSLNLVGAAQVGKASLTGMRVLHALRGIVPVWPFDPVPPTGPLLVEIYAAIAAVHAGARRGRTKVRDRAQLAAMIAPWDARLAEPNGPLSDDEGDAVLTAAWLRVAADDPALWHPAALTPALARTEGWTFGVR